MPSVPGTNAAAESARHRCVPRRGHRARSDRRAGRGQALSTRWPTTPIFLSPAAMEWLHVKQGDTRGAAQRHADRRAARRGRPGPSARRPAHRSDGYRRGAMALRAGSACSRASTCKLTRGRRPRRVQGAAGAASWQPAWLVDRNEDQEARTANMSRAYRVNLNVLALVALFTGAFLVFSTQALSVLRRRSAVCAAARARHDAPAAAGADPARRRGARHHRRAARPRCWLCDGGGARCTSSAAIWAAAISRACSRGRFRTGRGGCVLRARHRRRRCSAAPLRRWKRRARGPRRR